MNDLSSDENENVIDVFVLSRNDTEAPVRPEHLEQKGYRVTLFSDSAQLLETLRYGKPNLLVCDSLSLGQEAYDVCRQIKTDNHLWMIPVLVVTGASNLSDLLFMLDCNADNFIASPFDLSYLTSLIDVMLVTPVEPPTPDQIKTQFKIQHDDHMFVVTADRRRLLEFLLSSFEIAVNKSGELYREKADNHSLSERLKRSEESGAEQARVIDILNATIQEKESAISTLDDNVKEAANQISGLNREKEGLISERKENLARIASVEEMNLNLVKERDDAQSAHSDEARELNSRIENLSSDLAAARAELEETRATQLKETSRREDAESMLAELVPEKEKTDKALRALTLEFEQVRSMLSSEKNRAGAAEQEVKSLLQAKTQSEQDLTKIIDELKATARQQAEDLARLRESHVADADKIAGLESRLLALGAEKEQFEASLKKTADELRRELDEARKKVVATTSSLEAKNHEAAALEAAFREEKAGREQALSQVQSLEAELGSTRESLGEEKREHALAVESLRASLGERDAALAGLRGEHNDVKVTLEAHRDDLAQVKGELLAVSNDRDALKARLEEAEVQVGRLEGKLDAAAGDQAESDKQLRSLADELDHLKATLETERRQRHASEEELREATAAGQKTSEIIIQVKSEKEQFEKELAAEREAAARARADLEESQKLVAELEAQGKTERDEVAGLRSRLEEMRKEAMELDAKRKAENDEMASLRSQLEETRKQASELDAKRRAEYEATGSVQARLEEMQRRASELEDKYSAEHEALQEAGIRLREEEELSERRINELSAELETGRVQLRELSERLKDLEREKRDAQERADALAAEIDQARAALADEWEDHMSDHERLAEVMEEKRKAESPGTLPAVSSAAVADDGQEKAGPPVPSPPVRGVEDLFEDEEPGRDDGDARGDCNDDDLPSVSIVRDDSPNVDIPGLGPDDCPEDEDPEKEQEAQPEVFRFTQGESDANGDGEYPGDMTCNDDVISGNVSSGYVRPAVPSAGSAFSFDRSQWFELLKWAHQSGALSQDQRLQIVRMGRLIQKGRKLTNRQDEQVRELLSLVHSLGYRFD